MHLAMLLANGVEEAEAVILVDLLRRAGIDVRTFGVGMQTVTGSHGILLGTERVFGCAGDVPLDEFDGLLLPGGPAVKSLATNPEVLALVRTMAEAGKLVFAICAAPYILHRAGVLHNRRFTCFPDTRDQITSGSYDGAAVVTDGNLITSQGVGTSIDAALTVVARLVSPEAATELARRILHRV
jgi:4-methyl-5(b-hydroxyethyl)-thiazole monophosphate biosynthesis